MAADQTYYPEHEESRLDLGSYWSMLARRRIQFLVTAAIIFAVAIMLALGLPASYRSTATILIEEQEIPRDLVRSTISSYAAQQIQVITQRVMTMSNIMEVVDKYDLYGVDDAEARPASNRLVGKFRNNVKLELVSADVIDPRSGKPTQATIAFSLSFDSPDPATAKAVATELVNLYLEENLRTRANMAAGASEFLQAEAAALNEELKKMETEIAAFKSANEGALPELYQFNLSVIERSEREVAGVDLRIQELEKREIELLSDLAQLSPTAASVLPSGETVMSDADRLRALKSEYRKKSAIYHNDHPDLVRLKREIETLEASGNVGESRQELVAEISQQREQLSALRNTYKPDHPQVVKTERLVQEMEAELAAMDKAGAIASQVTPNNPAYVMVDTQLKSTRHELNRLRQQKAELKENADHHEDLIRRAPSVEKEYQGLLRDYETASVKYQEIKAKQREADVARNLEQGRKGERFTLIEPPAIPLSPHSPNRPAILFLGLMLAVGGGFAFVILLESLDGSVRGEASVTHIMGTAPLVVIPYLDNAEDHHQAARERKQIWAGFFLLILLTVVFGYFAYKPVASVGTGGTDISVKSPG